MKYLATLITLIFFLFVPNSMAFNKTGHDKHLPALYEILDKGDALEKQAALQMIRIAYDSEYHKDKFFDPILKLLKDKNPNVREAATAKFKRMAGGYRNKFYKSDIAKVSIVPALIRALSDKAASVRLEAAKALGYYQDLRAEDPLISALQDQELWIRFEAIHALGKIKAGAEAVIPLLNVIAVDDVWPAKLIQQEAMKTLTLILNQSAVTVRRKKAKDKYYKNGITVRQTLIDPRIRGKVISIILKKKNDSYLKASAIKLLDAMHIQLREDHSESVLKHLIASASDNNAQVRKIALSALFSIAYMCVQDADKTGRNITVHRYRSIVTDLCIAALKDPSVAVRKKAADLLGKSEDYKAVGPLIAALNGDNPDMQVAVITALANFNDPKMIVPLLNTLSDDSEAVRISAIDVLGDYDDLKVVRALPPHFESFKKGDDNAIVRKVFLDVVKATKEEIRIVYHYNGKRYVRKIDDTTSAVLPRNLEINGIKTLLYHPTAVESLLVALGDSKFKGHVTALKTLQRFEDERISQHIMPYIDNPSPVVRKAVLPLVFLSCDTEQAKLILHKAVNDSDLRVQKEARKLLKALETAFVKEDESVKLNIDALKNRDSVTRLAAVKALTRLNDNEAVNPLINCLNDADAKVRLYAVKALRQLKDKRAVMPLIQRLDDSDFRVRRESVDALKSLGDTRAVEPLLAQTDDKHIRVYVVRALPWFDDPRITEFFLELLQNPNDEMQLEAVKYFSRNPDPRAVKFLIPLLQSADKDMPSWAAGALGACKDKRAVKPLIKLLTRKPPVRDREKKNIYRYKRSAVLALGKIGDRRAYPLLVDALKDEELKGIAILALGHLQDKRAAPILLTYLSDPSPFTRSSAIRSLGEIGDSSLFDTLVPFLSDPNESIVKSTIHAVIRLEPERAQKILIDMLDTQDPATLERTLRLIGCSEARIVLSKLLKLAAARKGFNAVIGKQLSKCNNPEVAAILISHLKEEKNRDVRVTVIDILGEFDDPNVKGVLANYSNDPDPVVRRHASNALGEFKDVLIATLIEDDRSFGVRYTKGRHKLKSGYTTKLWSPERGVAPNGYRSRIISGPIALRKDPQVAKLIDEYTFDGYTCVHLEFENPTEIGTLIRQLNDTDPLTRLKATDYSGYLGDATIVPSIVPLLNYDQTAVRVSAARALGLLNVPSVWSYLVDALNDPDMNVKAMAVWALGEINAEKAVSGLTAFMKKHQDLRLMESSVKALARMDHKTAREVLMTSLAENKDYRVRMLAADAVGGLGDDQLRAYLEASLQDPSEYVRLAAVRSLVKLSGKNAVPLVAGVLNDNDFHVRKTAIETLGRIGDLRSVDPLTMLLMDEDKEIQKKTDTVLRKYAEDEDAKRIMGDIFLESINPDNLQDLRKSEKLLKILGKDYAIARLADPGGDETKTILQYLDLMLLQYKSGDLSKLGKRALNEFKDRELVIDFLTSFVLNRSDEDGKRRETIFFLERLKDAKSVPLFIHILENAPSFTLSEKRSACRYLGRIEHKNAAPLLRRMLSDSNENYTVRMDAARALGQISDKEAVELLIRTMGSSSENQALRQAAIHALGSIGEKQAVIPLIEVLKETNADHRLRTSAATSLGKIRDKRALPALEEAVKYLGDSKKDKFIKRAIKKALEELKAQRN